MELLDDNIVKWRDLLEKRKNQLLINENSIKKNAFLDLSIEGTGELSKTRLHPADLATDTQEVEILGTLSEKNIINIQMIEDALIRLENGTYGRCLSCNEFISEKRLKVLPETGYCIDCEKEYEQMQKNSSYQSPAKNQLLNQDFIKSQKILGDFLVSDIMQENPVTVRATESLDTAAALLSDNKIRHLPVVDSHGDIQGIISDRDVLGTLLKARPWKRQTRIENSWSQNLVSDVMTKSPETVDPNSNLKEAGSLILENKIGCLPVVEDGHLVGIITDSDFVRLVSLDI